MLRRVENRPSRVRGTWPLSNPQLRRTMNKSCLSAIAGALFSASLVFAQAGGGAAGGSSMGGTMGGMSGSNPGGSPTSPGSSLPDRSTHPDGSLRGNSRSGGLEGNGSDDPTNADPNSTLPRDRSMDPHGRGATGSSPAGSEGDSSDRDTGR